MIRFNMYCSEADLEIIDYEAKRENESRSEYLRKAGLMRANPSCARCLTIDALFDAIAKGENQDQDRGIDDLLEVAKQRLHGGDFGYKDIRQLLHDAFKAGLRSTP